MFNIDRFCEWLTAERDHAGPGNSIGIMPTGKTSGPADPTSISVLPGVLHVRVGWSMPTEKDYLHTEVWRAVNSTSFGSAALQTTVHGVVFYDMGAAVSTNTYSYWIIHVDRSGNPSNRYPTGSASSVSPNNVSQSEMQDNAVRQRYGSNTNSSQSISSGVTTTVESILVFHGDANTADVSFDFRNNSGSSKTFTVTIEDASGTVYYTFQSVFLADDGHFGNTVTITTFSGTSTTYRLRVNPSAGAVVNNTKLQVVLGKR